MVTGDYTWLLIELVFIMYGVLALMASIPMAIYLGQERLRKERQCGMR